MKGKIVDFACKKGNLNNAAEYEENISTGILADNEMLEETLTSRVIKEIALCLRAPSIKIMRSERESGMIKVLFFG